MDASPTAATTTATANAICALTRIQDTGVRREPCTASACSAKVRPTSVLTARHAGKAPHTSATTRLRAPANTTEVPSSSSRTQ